jgi:hypothetical protein
MGRLESVGPPTASLLSDAFNKRLERLTAAQQKALKNLLEKGL